MNRREVQELLDRYFEGLTSVEEERLLQRIMKETELPEDLKSLAPLFEFFEEEATQTNVDRKVKVKRRRVFMSKRRILGISVAASFLLFLGLSGYFGLFSPKGNGDIAYVDGVKITDITSIRSYANESFEKLKVEEEEIADQLAGFFDKK